MGGTRGERKNAMAHEMAGNEDAADVELADAQLLDSEFVSKGARARPTPSS